MHSRYIPLSVLLSVEHGCWVARCLEYDVVGQSTPGGPIDEALESLEVAFVGHVLMNVRDKLDAVHGLRQAPEHVFAKFKGAERLERELLFRMPDTLGDATDERIQLPRARANDLRVC
jgi:ABC-type microcin C transport system permease subunit YejB